MVAKYNPMDLEKKKRKLKNELWKSGEGERGKGVGGKGER